MNDDAHPSEQTEDIIELLDIVAPQETEPEGQSTDQPSAVVVASCAEAHDEETPTQLSDPVRDEAAAAAMTDSVVTEPAEKEAAGEASCHDKDTADVTGWQGQADITTEEVPCHDGDAPSEQTVSGKTPPCAADSEAATFEGARVEKKPEAGACDALAEETTAPEVESLRAEGVCCTAEPDVDPAAGQYDTKLRELEDRLAAAEQARDALSARLEGLEQQLADAGTMLLEDAGVRLRLEELVSHMLDAREPDSAPTERLDALEGRLRDWEQQSERRMMQAAARVIREEIAAMKADAG